MIRSDEDTVGALKEATQSVESRTDGKTSQRIVTITFERFDERSETTRRGEVVLESADWTKSSCPQEFLRQIFDSFHSTPRIDPDEWLELRDYWEDK